MDRGQPVTGPEIRGFSGNGYRLDDVTVATALLLTPDTAMDWTPPAIADLTVDAIAPLLDPLPEFILIGTGARLARPPRALPDPPRKQAAKKHAQTFFGAVVPAPSRA